MGTSRFRSRVVLPLLGLLGSACSSEKVAGPPVVSAVIVTPGADTLVTFGRTRLFSGVAEDKNGNPVAGVALIWHSSNPNVATVDSTTGLVTAVGNGLSVISAQAGAVAGQASFAVAQVVASVTVTPGSAALTAVGLTKAFTAVAKDSGGATVTGVRFLWLSSDNTVAVVDTLGVAKSKGPGQAIITAAGRGIPGNAVLTVTQNAVHLAFIGGVPDVVAGGAFPAAILVEIEDSAGAVVTGSHTPVTIGMNSGGLGNLTGTVTVAPSGGVATFIGVGYDGLDGPHTLIAFAAGVTDALSPSFAVTPGTATQVFWAAGDGTNELVGDTEPQPPGPWAYTVLDRFGNVATTSTDSVRLIVTASEWGSHLRGPTATVPSNGVATFSGFWFDRPGQRVFLAAVVNGDTSSPGGAE
ncbi:MAG TPA: Ig-like domain-containing protein, partial [Gemmatimonadales bacterium]|nr:Ig-like domain-containing protein [Gemmatimonadales bacterium]